MRTVNSSPIPRPARSQVTSGGVRVQVAPPTSLAARRVLPAGTRSVARTGVLAGPTTPLLRTTLSRWITLPGLKGPLPSSTVVVMLRSGLGPVGVVVEVAVAVLVAVGVAVAVAVVVGVAVC